MNDKEMTENDFKSQKELCLKEISELKQTIEDLRSGGERFRIAYSTSPDSININRLSDGLYVNINEGFTNILGYTESDSLGRTSLEMNIWVRPDDRAWVVKEVMAKGKVTNFETQFLSKSGKIIDGSLSASLMDLDGVPHLLTVTRDISVHKQAEEALAKEQFLISALMNNLSDHVYFKDLESKFIINNMAHARSFGLSDPKEVIGKSDFDFFTEDAARQAYEDEQSIIRTGKTILKEEKLTRKDSSDVWFSAMKMPLRNKDGEIIGTFGISRDISIRKRNEFENQALLEITQGLTTTNNLDELLHLIHTSLSKVVYAENCFIALFDKNNGTFSFPYFIDKEDSTPSPTSMAKSCSAYVFRSVKPVLLTQALFDQLEASGEVELVGSNSPSWVGIPLQTPSEVIGVLVLQHYENENVYSEKDVKFLVSIGSQIALAIERRKSEDEINTKNEQLQALNAEKDKFFSIIAHDLRGPLSAFVGATQILTEEIQSMDTAEIREIAMSMKTSASNIYNLLENLLEWSRLKRGGVVFLSEKLKLHDIVLGCVHVLSEPAKKKNIEISQSLDENIEVLADRHMLETVLRNLISNAVKFTRTKGKVQISAGYIKDDRIEVKISDSGIGMDEELLSKLFRINEKTSRNGTDGELSTGLGLLLCREFIEQCGGQIWAESITGEGSIFHFTLRRGKD